MPDEQTPEHSAGAVTDALRDETGAGESLGGAPAIPGASILAALSGDAPAESGGGNQEADDGDSQGGGVAPGKADAKNLRHSAGYRNGQERYSLADFTRAVAQAKIESDKAGDDGVVRRTALLLGMGIEVVRERIDRNPELRALYRIGPRTSTDPAAPTAAEVADKTDKTRLRTSQLNIEPAPVDLVEIISDCDRQLHELGLRKMGLSEALLKRIKQLDDLAPNTGKFISISLDKLSRSYYVQIMELMELAHDTRRRLMAKADEPDYITSEEARAFFNRNYTDMVKEGGAAFERMLNAAQAMVEMMIKTQGLENPVTGKKKKPGWAIVDAGHGRLPPPS